MRGVLGCMRRAGKYSEVLRGEVPKMSRQRSGFVPSEPTIKDAIVGILP